MAEEMFLQMEKYLHHTVYLTVRTEFEITSALE
jgi:hypothetical protein